MGARRIHSLPWLPESRAARARRDGLARVGLLAACLTVGVAGGCRRSGNPRAGAAPLQPTAVTTRPAAVGAAPAATGPPPDLAAAKREGAATPHSAAAQERLGAAYLAQGQLADAARALRAAARLDPRSESAWRALADLYRQARYLDYERDALEHLARLGVGDPAPYVRLGTMYVDLHWNDRAPAVLDRALQLDPRSADATKEMARYEFSVGKTPDAIARLQAFLRQQPDDPEATGLLAQYLMALRRFPEAEAAIRAGLRLRPDDRALSLILAYNLVQRQDGDHAAEAIQLLQDVLKRDPTGAEPYCWLGRAYERANRPADAMAAYRSAMRYDPTFENVTFALGNLCLRHGRAAEGRYLLDDYARVQKNSQAFAAAYDTVARLPNDSRAHETMATWYQRTGQPAKAVVEFRRALELRPAGPNRAECERGLRAALLASGRDTEARQLARAAGGE